MVCADMGAAWPVNEDNKTRKREESEPSPGSATQLNRGVEVKLINAVRVSDCPLTCPRLLHLPP